MLKTCLMMMNKNIFYLDIQNIQIPNVLDGKGHRMYPTVVLINGVSTQSKHHTIVGGIVSHDCPLDVISIQTENFNELVKQQFDVDSRVAVVTKPSDEWC